MSKNELSDWQKTATLAITTAFFKKPQGYISEDYIDGVLDSIAAVIGVELPRDNCDGKEQEASD